MDKDYIVEKHVIERYVNGALTGEELEHFELYMLDHPTVLEDIEYCREMTAALKRSFNDFREKSRTARDGWFFSRTYAMAATAFVAAFLASSIKLLNDVRHLRSAVFELEAPSEVQAAVIMELERSSQQISPMIVNLTTNSLVLLEIYPTLPSESQLVVAIDGENTDYSWKTTLTTKTASGAFRLAVRNMPEGSYTITTSGLESSSTGQLRIRVQPR